MVVCIVLWPYLLTTKLRRGLQKNNIGHTILYVTTSVQNSSRSSLIYKYIYLKHYKKLGTIGTKCGFKSWEKVDLDDYNPFDGKTQI